MAVLRADRWAGRKTAFISLAEALAARGHDVTIHNHCGASMKRHGAVWEPLKRAFRNSRSLYRQSRRPPDPSGPGRAGAVFWTHNPAQYLNKWRYWRKMARWRPTVVFSSEFHARSIAAWMPTGGKETIPTESGGVSGGRPARNLPLPHVAFTSSPLRSLDWLLASGSRVSVNTCPAPNSSVFSSLETYGAHGDARADVQNAVLDRARAMAELGVVLRDPLPKADLAEALAGFRAILYRGDPGETYCLAVGEAQAVGVPVVVQEDIGCVAERVVEGETGFVAADDTDFARRGCAILMMTNSGGVFTLLQLAQQRIERSCRRRFRKASARMKILQTMAGGDVGGAEEFLVRLASAFETRGLDQTVVVRPNERRNPVPGRRVSIP